MLATAFAGAVLLGCTPCHYSAHSGVHIVESGESCFIEAKHCVRVGAFCNRPGDSTVVAREDSPAVDESRAFYVQPQTAASALIPQLANHSVYVLDGSVAFDAATRVATVSGRTLRCGRSLLEPLPLLQNFTAVGSSNSVGDGDEGTVLVLTVLAFFIFVVLVTGAKATCRRRWSVRCAAASAYGVVCSMLAVAAVLIWIETR